MKITEGDVEFKKYLIGLGTTACYFGGDPEFFIGDPSGGILNSDKFFPGKDKPIQVMRAGESNPIGKVYFDGIQAELGFSHSNCRETVISRIAMTLAAAQNKIAENKIILKPAVRVKKSVIDQADPQARIFGCAPDFNAYTRSVNTPPMDASRHLYRYAGGHVHIGISSYGKLDSASMKDPENHLAFVKAFDLIVSLPLLALDNAPGSKLRRTKYGKAGCFRPTPYGLEYRTPSCWWLQSPISASLVFGLMRLSWTLSCNKAFDKFMQIAKLEEGDIRGIVDEGDLKEAAKVWDKIRPYVSVMGNAFSNPVNYLSFAPWKVRPNGAIERNIYSKEEVETLANTEKKTAEGEDPIAFTAMPLMLYEYMVKNGTEGVIGDLTHEWNLKSTLYMRTYGIYSGCTHKMTSNKECESLQSSLKVQQDFFKFQKSMVKELY
jgi:hypothetical protein